jgi:DNA modification methylase
LYQPLAESTQRVFKHRKQVAVVRDGVRRKSARTEDLSLGAPIGDVWADINIIAPQARKRTGFETQKPERLLERLILMRTQPGDLVIDPTCGSGTTAVVAQRLGRSVVAIDRSEVALQCARERLRAVGDALTFEG